MLRSELKSQGLPLTREQTRKLSGKWRREYGLGVLVDRAMEVFASRGGEQKFKGLVIASLRNPGEADSVHGYGGLVLWIDADPKVRYERVRANAALRGADREADDQVSFDKFLADEAAEMGQADNNDPTALSMSGVKAKSDLFLVNDGHDLDQLSAELNQLLGFNVH